MRKAGGACRRRILGRNGAHRRGSGKAKYAVLDKPHTSRSGPAECPGVVETFRRLAVGPAGTRSRKGSEGGTEWSYTARQLAGCDEDHYKAAGILPFAIERGEVYGLLGRQSSKKARATEGSKVAEGGLKTCAIMGGKRKKTDRNALDTATREAYEESWRRFGRNIDIKRLRGVHWYAAGRYAAFLYEVSDVEVEEALRAPADPHASWETEGLVWVPLASLVWGQPSHGFVLSRFTRRMLTDRPLADFFASLWDTRWEASQGKGARRGRK